MIFGGDRLSQTEFVIYWDSSYSKARALTDIAEAQAKLKQWGDALHTTKQCPSYDCRVESLSKVLTVYAELKNPELKKKEEWI